MNNPIKALTAGLVSMIGTATGKNVYTIVPTDAAMPFVLIEDITVTDIGDKDNPLYEVDLAFNIPDDNATSIADVEDVAEDVMGTIRDIDTLSVTGYTVISNRFIGTSSLLQKVDNINYYSNIIRVKYWLTKN